MARVDLVVEQNLSIPLVDFTGIENPEKRGIIMEQVCDASRTWGFFMIKNHGIPLEIMDEMIEAVPRFKMPNINRRFKYSSNYFVLKSNWGKDSINVFDPDAYHTDEFPDICRDILITYSDHIMKLGLTMFELLSEGLGLAPNHLKNLHVADRVALIGQYADQELNLVTNSHTDTGFLSIFQQGQTGSLQINHQDQWVDVPSVPETLIVNIADLLQIITNDEYKSEYHRAKVRDVGPKISVGSHFRPHIVDGVPPMHISPIKELLSEENPPLYREITVQEYLDMKFTNGLNVTPFMAPFRLNKKNMDT